MMVYLSPFGATMIGCSTPTARMDAASSFSAASSKVRRGCSRLGSICPMGSMRTASTGSAGCAGCACSCCASATTSSPSSAPSPRPRPRCIFFAMFNPPTGDQRSPLLDPFRSRRVFDSGARRAPLRRKRDAGICRTFPVAYSLLPVSRLPTASPAAPPPAPDRPSRRCCARRTGGSAGRSWAPR